MKISKTELRKIISEELEVILTNEEVGELFGEEVQQQLEGDDHGEGSMAVNQLSNIGEMTGELADLISDSDDLDEWVEAKITKAHDYLNTVLNHLSADGLDLGLQVDKDTFSRMKGIATQRPNPRLRYKENKTNENQEK